LVNDDEGSGVEAPILVETPVYHPLLLQREVLNELPGLLDDRRACDEPAVWPGYRSEAFAEDLVAPEAPSAVVRRTPRVLPVLLAGAPLLAAVLGGAAALFVNIY
jgi:hypothetical protein